MAKPWQLDRRTFLRSAKASVALPMLDAMLPSVSAADSSNAVPRRMLCIGVHLGFHGPAFFPSETGDNYQTSELLRPVERFRDRFTVFSGLDHPGVGKGHGATVSYLTGVTQPRKQRQQSVDQVAAGIIGQDTRFLSLVLEANGGDPGKGRHLSWAAGGIPLPLETNPKTLFNDLFSKKQERASLDDAKSILDHVLEDTYRLQRRLGRSDREKLEEYLTSIREVERGIEKARTESIASRNDIEKLAEQVSVPSTLSGDIRVNSRLMYRLVALAFQADLTRVATLRIPGDNHAASHHGQQPGKLRTYINEKRGYMEDFAGVLGALESFQTPGGSLLDNTMVMMGSGIGNASTHSTRNLPILLAGGGLKHGRHLHFSGTSKPPLSDLYVTMLQNMGVKQNRFSSSQGSMNDLLLRS